MHFTIKTVRVGNGGKDQKQRWTAPPVPGAAQGLEVCRYTGLDSFSDVT